MINYLKLVVSTGAAYIMAALMFFIAFAVEDTGQPWYFWASYGVVSLLLAFTLTWLLVRYTAASKESHDDRA